MHAEGLAICIAPNLLRGPDPMSHLAYMGPSTSFVKNLILLVSFGCDVFSGSNHFFTFALLCLVP
jgi:hypothetical protein